MTVFSGDFELVPDIVFSTISFRVIRAFSGVRFADFDEAVVD